MKNDKHLQTTILRIQRMETFLDAVTAALRDDPQSLQKNTALQNMIRELDAYMQSGTWLSDYECDSRGELPRGLKRGVLAQDTLYGVLSEVKQLAN